MRKSASLLILLAAFGLSAVFYAFKKQSADPQYTASQLMEPAVLAGILNDPKKPDPIILNVGTMQLIKGAVPAGPGATDEGMLSFKAQVSQYAHNQPIVIYCGCCALEHCPNVGPAMDYLQDQGFKSARILHIEKSLKTEWIDKGYPMN